MQLKYDKPALNQNHKMTSYCCHFFEWGFLALLGYFGYSQNGGDTLSDFLIFFLRGYIPAQPQIQVWKRRINTLNLAINSPKIPTLAPLFLVPGWVREFLLLVLGFGGLTKGMISIWGHFAILVECGLVKQQIMLYNKYFSNIIMIF